MKYILLLNEMQHQQSASILENLVYWLHCDTCVLWIQRYMGAYIKNMTVFRNVFIKHSIVDHTSFSLSCAALSLAVTLADLAVIFSLTRCCRTQHDPSGLSGCFSCTCTHSQMTRRNDSSYRWQCYSVAAISL